MNWRYRIGPANIDVDASHEPIDTGNSYFEPFRTQEGAPDLRIRVITEAAPEGPRRATASLRNHWKLFRLKDGLRLEILEQLRKTPRLIALINPAWNQITAYVVPASTVPGNWHLAQTMDPLVQWWMTAWLARESRGVVLHSAAVAFEDGGAAFIGRSGAGKSTMAGWCHGEPGLTVLNDERIIIWRDGKQWKIAGTPWSGDLAQASGHIVRLKRLHLLVQATENRFVHLKPSQSLFRLLEEASMPVWDSALTANTVAAAASLLSEIPCGELHNRRERTIVDFLKEQLLERSPSAV